MRSKRRGRRPSGGKSGGKPGGRPLAVRIKTAKGRKPSSTRWLKRQLNDPYVAEARRRGYRSRAAWKLIQLDDRLRFLAPGRTVVDLGAAPGGWTQVAVARVAALGPNGPDGGRDDGDDGGDGGGRGARRGRVIAVDMIDMEPVEGAEMLTLDLRDAAAPDKLEAVTGGAADVVLSDMAPPATGHRATDYLRNAVLCEAAAAFACRVLAANGTLVIKVLRGGAESDLLAGLNRQFARVRHVKPPASRDQSSETYLVATGFHGRE
jgi:23S rRNA (uridine2552-2'-O)-methyltransferase